MLILMGQRITLGVFFFSSSAQKLGIRRPLYPFYNKKPMGNWEWNFYINKFIQITGYLESTETQNPTMINNESNRNDKHWITTPKIHHR